MQEYVVGFMFDEEFSQVVLIRKNRPDWQDGHFNGVGGKIESGETALQAMEREFREETDFKYTQHWAHFATLVAEDSRIFCFKDECENVSSKVQTVTDEEVFVVPIENVNLITSVQSLLYLIPMARLNADEIFEITESYDSV